MKRTWHESLLAGLLVCLLVASGASAVAQENEKSSDGAETADRVQMGAVLVRDGHYDRAGRVLDKVDVSSEEVDKSLYYTLRGMIALRSGNDAEAVEQLHTAIRNGQTKEMVFVFLAQAFYGLQNWEKTILSVRNADEAGEDMPELYLMKAHAQRELGRTDAAWQTLVDGARRFPEHSKFWRKKVSLLVEAGLYRQAMETGQRHLRKAAATSEVTPDDYLTLARAFRQSDRLTMAERLLEEARLRFPDNLDVLLHLAHVYVADEKLNAAGDLMQIAAEADPTYRQKAAELFRRAESFNRALYLNAQIADQEAKFRQRAAIMLDQKRFEQMTMMHDRLSRLGLLEDPKLAYAVAYAHFKSANWEQAEAMLDQIEDPEFFERVVQLRRAVDSAKKR